MRSRGLPRTEISGGQDGIGARSGDARASEAAILKTFPASVLVTTLTKRIVIAARDWFALLTHAVSRLQLHGKSRAEPLSATEAGPARHSPIQRGFAFAIVLLPAAYIIYCIVTIPFAGGAPTQPAPSAMVFEAADGRPFATRGILKGQGIAADQIPPLLASAVTAIEDRRFYQHGGIDLRAMSRAAWHDLTGRRLEGGSTIAQQLARRLYLSPDRTLKRKIQEAALAEWLAVSRSKNEILADYLNTVYFGDGAYGADSAAVRYFGKSARELSLSEAAMPKTVRISASSRMCFPAT